MHTRTGSIPQYETQIVDKRGKVVFSYTQPYLSDFIAIRSALTICCDDEHAEVWRGDVCIYERGRVTSAVAARKWG